MLICRGVAARITRIVTNQWSWIVVSLHLHIMGHGNLRSKTLPQCCVCPTGNSRPYQIIKGQWWLYQVKLISYIITSQKLRPAESPWGKLKRGIGGWGFRPPSYDRLGGVDWSTEEWHIFSLRLSLGWRTTQDSCGSFCISVRCFGRIGWCKWPYILGMALLPVTVDHQVFCIYICFLPLLLRGT